MTSLTSYRAWFLDLDGTLVDSDAAHERAYIGALETLAPQVARSFDYASARGRSTSDVVRDLGLVDPDVHGRLVAEKQRRYRAALASGEIAPFPGAADLIRRLLAAGCSVFVVTGASRRSADACLTGLGVRDYISGMVCAEDVPSGKPAPDPYLAATALAPPVPGIAVEDAVDGVRSALAAGLPVLQVHTSRPVLGAARESGSGGALDLLGLCRALAS